MFYNLATATTTTTTTTTIRMSESCFLYTERLVLQPITPAHAAFYLRLMNSPKWHEFIGDRQVYTEDAARLYIEQRMSTQWQTLGYGNFIVYKRRKEDVQKTSEEGDTGVPIGAVGIFTRPGLEYSDLGFAFLSDYEGKGYATEASLRVLEEARLHYGIKTLQAITDPKNTACQKLLTRLQFQCQGSIVLPNETKETLLYKLEL